MSSKENEYDALGQRMKRYEEVMNSSKLIPDLPLYFRIDGRHFSKLTKNLGYPFKDLPAEKRSYVFTQLMQMTAHGIMEEFKCDIIETHSDEINGGFKNIKTAPFDGAHKKINKDYTKILLAHPGYREWAKVHGKAMKKHI